MSNTGYRLTMKKLPPDIRPRERLLRYGANGLSDVELLAIILGTGTKKETVLQLSQRILSKFEALHNLSTVTFEELTEICGVGEAKASQILAAIEVGKRVNATANRKIFFISCPNDVANLCMSEMRCFEKECFKALFLNTKNRVLKVIEISTGSLSSSIVHPRELFKFAVKCSAASVIVVHNHPSGDPAPSKEDICLTKRLKDAGKILGIDLLDHVIIGDGNYISLKESGFI
ncbi:MAG TPA: JAB domain-containing protein [Actinobacteria bacterium]|nr:JAB domain-containing protein [Actinomycetota bacterium]